MNSPARLGLREMLQLGVVVVLATSLRVGYFHLATDNGVRAAALAVQGDGPKPLLPAPLELPEQAAPTELDILVHQLTVHHNFDAYAPLAQRAEPTAHVAPGYPWLVSQLAQIDAQPGALVRWLQCGLGVFTVCCLYFFVRRAMGSNGAALLAGLMAALHPFWIMNAAELNDGTVATFLLSLALLLGTRASQEGGAFTSALFGLSLAALAMVRAATLPFAIVALLWFLYQCKHVRNGWFNAILAVLGFANGLAPWAVRNWRLYDEPVPVATSAYLHLWVGTNPLADGGPLDETALRRSLPAERLERLLAEPNQARRYASLGRDVWDEATRDPAGTLRRRLQAGMKFLMGDGWFRDQRMSRERPPGDAATRNASSDWLPGDVEAWLQGSLLALLSLSILGWRWSAVWKRSARLGTIAFVLLPIPYLLSHAEPLSGPRLPWDALLICYSAYAIACLAPAVASSAEEEPPKLS